MERLTYDFCIGGNHCWQVKGADNLECREVCERQGDDGCKTCPIAKAFDRLAAYEDTGLEPEDVVKIKQDVEDGYIKSTARRYGIDVSRLRELAQAVRDVRCVVLPAAIGTTVYHITTCKDFPRVLDGTLYDSNGGHGTATGYYCPCELAENCPFDAEDFDCDKNGNKLNIFEDTVEGINIDDYENYIRLNYSGAVDFEDIGRTVFLTRKEAEAALRREQE